MSVHQAERAAVGVPDLVWSDKLAADATQWAVYLTKRGELVHHWEVSGTMTGSGENLWRGTHGVWSPAQMTAAWASEKRLFVPGIFPNVSVTGSSKEVGHYTQMVWRKTTEVGCGLVSDGRMDYFVCRYESPGNFRKQPVF